MERYRNFIRIEQMKEYIRDGKKDEALEIAETIDCSKLKSKAELNAVADLYLDKGMPLKAREYLQEIYRRGKTRGVLMQLVNLSIKLKKADEAERYFEEFSELAEGDFYNYIFRFSIDRLKGKPYETLIASLEKLKAKEYIDSWAYELAKLYHKSGQQDKCIAECNDIITWFGDGEYVERARALKAYYLGELDFEEDLQLSEKQKPEEEHSDVPGYDTDDGQEYEIEEEPVEEEYDTDESRGYVSEEEPVEEAYDVNDGQEYESEEEAAEEEYTPEEVHEALEEIPEIKVENDADEELIYKLLAEEEDLLAAMVREDAGEKEEKQKNDYEPVQKISYESAEEVREIVGESLKDDDEDTVERPEVAEHSFKGLEVHKISENSLLGKFLEEHNCGLEDYFGYFGYQDDVRSQLIKILEILLNPKTSNMCMVISGEKHCGINLVIKGIAKILHQSGSLRDGKVANSDSAKINEMKLSQKTEKLEGCCLVIGRAGHLTGEAVGEILASGKAFAGKTAVILTDTRPDINKLLRDNRELNSLFPLRIHFPEFSEKDLVDLLFVRLEENSLAIEKEACDKLTKELKKLARISGEGVLETADRLIRDAIEAAQMREAKVYIDASRAGKKYRGESGILLSEDVQI